ncbi:MAG: flagellar biosynthesis anti-sigma factor FlgM [Nitrospira sp.]|nr:flagellar biosynthesis anti-sigma factor FlgM [bacterium]MBL7048043.1 flagellar biosynthesis anti-sigma factor FlgM [Nitrospira sp.]
MKIQGGSQVDSSEILKSKLQQVGKSNVETKKTDSEKSGSSEDKVSLSGGVKGMAGLKAQIEQLPDVRTDKVEALTKSIDSGLYNFDSMKVAERVLEEI